MSEDRNFQQRWGLRERDDVDSSSDESKSCSQDDLILKKQRLVPSSQFHDKTKINNSPLPHCDIEVGSSKGVSFGTGKIGKESKEIKASKEKKESKENKKKKEIKEKLAIKKHRKSDTKRKCKNKKIARGKFKPISFDSFEVFTKSIIDDLKMAREEMFARMNEEMGIASHAKLVSRPKKKKESLVEKVEKENCKTKIDLGKKARKTNGLSLKRSVKSDRAKGSNKSCEIIEDGVISAENQGPVSLENTTKIKSSNIPLKEPIYNFSDRLVSSPFSNLPNAVPEPRPPNLIAPSKEIGKNLESATLRNNEIPLRGYFSGNQMPEQFQNINQMGFHNMGYFNQLRNRNPSIGFPGTLHQGLRNGLGFSGQTTENLSRGNDIFGLRNSLGFSSNIVGNNNGKLD